jgi:flagellum-specific ATP synthase
MGNAIEEAIAALHRLPDWQVRGTVVTVKGLRVECAGLSREISMGARCRIQTHHGTPLLCEVVGFHDNHAVLLPYADLDGVGPGCSVEPVSSSAVVYPTTAWLGRVVNALGEPVDGGPPLPMGVTPYPLRANPPPAHKRQRVGEKLDLGVRSMNTFLTCCRGQRMGIFSGSGVGKSTVMAMISRYANADVSVIGLTGERGREVQEFLQDNLGEEGLARSVVVVATSDESAVMRKQATYLTLTLAEFFRDQQMQVLCMIDSLTRFAMAQREIGLAAGEPPTSKGYPPTVFAELPRLLERAGPGTGEGSITGLFTVLVEGDDTNEPISDAVRGIVDGHIVMRRAIAERGRFPAVDVLKSVSRTMPDCNSDRENALIARARGLMSTYEDMADMIRLGAYRKGSSKEVDQAIQFYPALEKFLTQGKKEFTDLESGYRMLAELLGVEWG